MTSEQRVRAAAAELHDAIAEAVAAGYRIDWPARSSDLPAIAISATGSVVTELVSDAAPKPLPLAE